MELLTFTRALPTELFCCAFIGRMIIIARLESTRYPVWRITGFTSAQFLEAFNMGISAGRA